MRFVLIFSVLALMSLLWLSYNPMPATHTSDPLEQINQLQLDGL